MVVLILGFMVGIQFRVSQGQALGPENLGGMATLLLASQNRDAALAQEVSHLQSLLASKLKGEAEYNTLLSQLHQSEAAAGLTPVTGAGVVVILSQPPGVPNSGSVFSIHDTDVLIILNELRAAGAEALSINGQRVVSTTEVRQAGSIFSINNTPAAPPFTITAIGPPQTMMAALKLAGGIVDTLMAVGIGVSIQTAPHATVPAYLGGNLP